MDSEAAKRETQIIASFTSRIVGDEIFANSNS